MRCRWDDMAPASVLSRDLITAENGFRRDLRLILRTQSEDRAMEPPLEAGGEAPGI